ncbi:hypothetical protein GCM10009646_43280 [Streptomyces aureus]
MFDGEVGVDQGPLSGIPPTVVPLEPGRMAPGELIEGVGGGLVDERLLGGELLVEGAVGQTGRLHQVGDADVRALLPEQPRGGIHHPPAVLLRLRLRYAAHGHLPRELSTLLDADWHLS